MSNTINDPLDDAIGKLKEGIVADGYYSLQPPVTINDLQLRLSMTSEGESLSADFLRSNSEYRRFLTTMNGVEFEGLVLYGVSDSDHPNSAGINIFTINKENSNNPVYVDQNITDKVQVGHLAPCIYLYNPETRVFEERDEIGTDYVSAEFDSLSTLILHLLGRLNIA